MMPWAQSAAIVALALLASDAPGADPAAAQVVPHVKDSGQQAYGRFFSSETHRAFAIAPGGAWSWTAEAPSRDIAEQGALQACREKTPQKCVLYAVDDENVFDAQTWPTLWGPYKSADQARQAATGTKPGERLPELAFKSADGKAVKLSALRGKIVVLHFWGSWCTPCRHEMPDLQALRDALKDKPDIAFVLLQAREAFPVSRQWAKEHGVALPLFDSGSRGVDDTDFTLADGSRIADRTLSAQFPTTFVLDQRGLVLFSHFGAVPRWSEYADFLRDAAAKSGR
jgi:thiol-disulfide isomerase/thioredoxin